jgi:hypothetical protein
MIWVIYSGWSRIQGSKKHWILDPQPDHGIKCQFLISLNIVLYLQKNSRKYDLGCTVYPGSVFLSFPEPGSAIWISDPRAKKAVDPGSATWWLKQMSVFHLPVSLYCSLLSKTFNKLWEIWSGLYLTGSGFFPSQIPDLDIGSWIRNLTVEANVSSYSLWILLFSFQAKQAGARSRPDTGVEPGSWRYGGTTSGTGYQFYHLR